jgi:ABC-type Fe3+ transport system permease subunit
MPLAIYASFDGSGGLDEAVTLSVILVVVSFAVLLIFKGLSRLGARAWSRVEEVSITGKPTPNVSENPQA